MRFHIKGIDLITHLYFGDLLEAALGRYQRGEAKAIHVGFVGIADIKHPVAPFHSTGKGLKSDWGFSCLIETERKNILFDTGANPKILHNNMKILCINPSNIDKIIISHEHWDHNGGLELFKPFSQKVELFRIIENKDNSFSKCSMIEDLREIEPSILTTGKLPGFPVDEQSLIIGASCDEAGRHL